MRFSHTRPAYLYLPDFAAICILRCIKFVTRAPAAATLRSFNMVKMIAEKVTAWRRYRTSVRELSRLTDRELSDLGLNRYDIDAVARKSAGL